MILSLPRGLLVLMSAFLSVQANFDYDLSFTGVTNNVYTPTEANFALQFSKATDKTHGVEVYARGCKNVISNITDVVESVVIEDDPLIANNGTTFFFVAVNFAQNHMTALLDDGTAFFNILNTTQAKLQFCVRVDLYPPFQEFADVSVNFREVEVTWNIALGLASFATNEDFVIAGESFKDFEVPEEEMEYARPQIIDGAVIHRIGIPLNASSLSDEIKVDGLLVSLAQPSDCDDTFDPKYYSVAVTRNQDVLTEHTVEIYFNHSVSGNGLLNHPNAPIETIGSRKIVTICIEVIRPFNMPVYVARKAARNSQVSRLLQDEEDAEYKFEYEFDADYVKVSIIFSVSIPEDPNAEIIIEAQVEKRASGFSQGAGGVGDQTYSVVLTQLNYDFDVCRCDENGVCDANLPSPIIYLQGSALHVCLELGTNQVEFGNVLKFALSQPIADVDASRVYFPVFQGTPNGVSAVTIESVADASPPGYSKARISTVLISDLFRDPNPQDISASGIALFKFPTASSTGRQLAEEMMQPTDMDQDFSHQNRRLAAGDNFDVLVNLKGNVMVDYSPSSGAFQKTSYFGWILSIAMIFV